MSIGSPTRRSTRAAMLAALVLALLPVSLAGQNIQSQQVPVEPRPPARDFSDDLQLKITAPFTIASVGDVMIKRPASSFQDAGMQDLFGILRRADISVGNMEGNLADIPRFDGPLSGMMGSKEVAPDLKAMGFDLLARANNHIFDSEIEGLWSTIEQLDAAGIVHAGSGRNLADARAPVYLETPKGRVGFVALHSVHSARYAGQPPTTEVANIGGRAGLNSLRTTVFHNVTRERLDQLKALRREMYTSPAGSTNVSVAPQDAGEERIQLLDTWYQVGTPGTKSFEMNEADLNGILRSIRNGKTLADLMVVTIHAHQGPLTAQQWLFEDQTPDFLIDLAHQAIDNGADVFVGHGPHVVRGIEIYNGKPIFYGMGEFFYQWQHMDASLMSGSWEAIPEDPEAVSDVAARVSAGARPVQYESMIAESSYNNGRLVEVRLHPVYGNWDGPISRLGTPRKAPPDIAQRILERVARLSQPFGTRIQIENGVGVIRVTGTATNNNNNQ
jgi:poly-gamma-glutamate capsule biosynthesis protein CapA/YwtB (metallophosphatase superfamily)